MSILQQLADVLEQRKNESAEASYVASLYAGGTNKILQKIGEEATEVIIAAKNAQGASNGKALEELVGETADLWFHTLLMLGEFDIDAQPVLAELGKRFGLSGIEEKAQRKTRS